MTLLFSTAIYPLSCTRKTAPTTSIRSLNLCKRNARFSVRRAIAVPSSAASTTQNGAARTFIPAYQPAEGFDSIEDALKSMAKGEFLVVLDDEDRENEGDLIIAADKITTEQMAFMINETSGLICIGMTKEICDKLDLPLMVSSKENDESMYTAFTHSVDLREGTHTGISAEDRTLTTRALADPASTPMSFRRPGHIFPLKAQNSGTLVRPGHTEAAVDLCRLAGCAPAGALCEIVNREDGTMQRTPQLKAFSAENDMRIITIRDLVKYRLYHEDLVVPVTTTTTDSVVVSSELYGSFEMHEFTSNVDSSTVYACVFGDRQGAENVEVCLAEEKFLQDVFGVVGAQGGVNEVVCHGNVCGEEESKNAVMASSESVHEAMTRLSQSGGVLIYQRSHKGTVQHPGPTLPTETRAAIAAEILDKHLGVASVHIENPADARQVASFGTKVQGWVEATTNSTTK